MLVGIPAKNICCHLEISELQPDCAISSASLNSLPIFCNSSKCLKVQSLATVMYEVSRMYTRHACLSLAYKMYGSMNAIG